LQHGNSNRRDNIESCEGNHFKEKNMHQPLHYRLTFPVLASLILALFFCGCATSTSGSGSLPSGNPPKANTPPPSQNTKPALANLSDYCNLVSLSEVSKITGLAITHLTPDTNPSHGEVICGYAANINMSTGAVVIFVISPDSGKAGNIFNAFKQQAQSKGAAVANLSGIGDSACTIVQNNTASVGVLKGSVVFFTSGTTPHPLPLSVDQPLAQLVASKL
jgi:hypothetical protein